MGFWKKVAASAVSAMAISACGVPMEGEESGLDVTETAQQAVYDVNHCATGDTANATSWLISSDQYIRTRSAMQACVNLRETTMVDFLGQAGIRYRFNASTEFPANQGLCFLNRFALRTMRLINGTWQEIDYQEQAGQWTGTTCRGALQYAVPSWFLSPSGDYRVRVKAIRADGSMETVNIMGVRLYP